MATPFFGKRETESPSPSHPLRSPGSNSYASPPHTPNSTPAGRPVTDVAPLPSQAAKEGGSKLTVGPNIKLKGVEITDCDTLVVEGTVEATMNSRVIKIAEQGAFHGTAEIDIAEIHGKFDGTLTVREKLVIYGSGKVSGTIRYGKVVIEEGGELTGQIEAGTSSSNSSAGSTSASAWSKSSAASTATAAASSSETSGSAAVA